MAYFYQNLGEAEYAVVLYTYMRILGYPSEKISVLTTYNGQRQLLVDIFNKRCANNPYLGLPREITTVDKFQGQQNDYVILSLVRTKSVGHLRDVRRMIVAMSRARLGLYILGRLSLFKDVPSISETFKSLTTLPTSIMIVPHEHHETNSRPFDDHMISQAVSINGITNFASFVSNLYAERVSAAGC